MCPPTNAGVFISKFKNTIVPAPQPYYENRINTSKITHRGAPIGGNLKPILNGPQLEEAYQSESLGLEHWPYHNMLKLKTVWSRRSDYD